ncbi:cytochrome c [Pelagibius sp. CAU 1746]|uniref:c-type cytochrome n=1 Tax=Pelagibius sp. CAU 1746 TaxID=3140370 RepID=UPI00325A68B4
MDPGDPDKVALGAQVYAANCASCHGANLEGQPNWRQRKADGRLPAPPHDVSGHTWHHPDAQLFALTKQGPAALAGGGYQSDMPGYAGTLSDAEIWAVLSYIKSRWPREVQVRHDGISQQ